MTTIILIRHGEVDGLDPPRFRGRQPLRLTAQGLRQASSTARRVAETWRPFRVITSPLERCVATGAAIAEACGIETACDDGLLDLDYGDWQWMTHDVVRDRWPRAYEIWRKTPHLIRFPSGESLQDVVSRVADVFRRVTDSYLNETIVLVGHDSVNRALLLQMLDQPLSAYWKLVQNPCCINVIKCDRDLIQVLSVNETGHLGTSKIEADYERRGTKWPSTPGKILTSTNPWPSRSSG